MKRLILILSLIFSFHLSAQADKFGVTGFNSNKIKMNDTITVSNRVRFNLGTKITFPDVNAYLYIDAEVLDSFLFEKRHYEKGEFFRFTNEYGNEISPLWWIKKNRTGSKGKSSTNTYEEFVDYMINDTLIITAFDNVIDKTNSYCLVYADGNTIRRIPMKVYPANPTYCYLTKEELKQYNVIPQNDQYFFIGLEYNGLVVINYLTVLIL